MASIRVDREFMLPCVVTLDEQGNITHAYVVPGHAALRAMLEEQLPRAERQAIAREATRSRFNENLVRVREGINVLSHWALVRLTRTQVVLRRPETSQEVRFNLTWGRQVGTHGYAAPRIDDEDLALLHERSKENRSAR